MPLWQGLAASGAGMIGAHLALGRGAEGGGKVALGKASHWVGTETRGVLECSSSPTPFFTRTALGWISPSYRKDTEGQRLWGPSSQSGCWSAPGGTPLTAPHYVTPVMLQSHHKAMGTRRPGSGHGGRGLPDCRQFLGDSLTNNIFCTPTVRHSSRCLGATALP